MENNGFSAEENEWLAAINKTASRKPKAYNEMMEIRKRQESDSIQRQMSNDEEIASSMAATDYGKTLGDAEVASINARRGIKTVPGKFTDGQVIGAGYNKNGDYQFDVARRNQDGKLVLSSRVVPKQQVFGIMKYYELDENGSGMFSQDTIGKVKDSILSQDGSYTESRFNELAGAYAQRRKGMDDKLAGLNDNVTSGRSQPKQRNNSQQRSDDRFDSRMIDALNNSLVQMEYDGEWLDGKFNPTGKKKLDQRQLEELNRKKAHLNKMLWGRAGYSEDVSENPEPKPQGGAAAFFGGGANPPKGNPNPKTNTPVTQKPVPSSVKFEHEVDEDYNTRLNKEEEQKYNKWVRDLPDSLRNVDDYDLRGYFLKYGEEPLPQKQEDGRVHLTDEFKKPNHKTFSNESVYSKGRYEKNARYAGSWNGEDFIPSSEKYSESEEGLTRNEKRLSDTFVKLGGMKDGDNYKIANYEYLPRDVKNKFANTYDEISEEVLELQRKANEARKSYEDGRAKYESEARKRFPNSESKRRKWIDDQMNFRHPGNLMNSIEFQPWNN